MSAERGLADEPDEVLVQVVLARGSEAAFRALYGRHSPRIYRIVFRMLGVESDAEDVLQETWMRASSRLERFEWKSALSTWLTAIAVNCARDLLERRGRWNDVDSSDDIAGPHGDAGLLIDIEKAVAQLSPGSRTAFLLHDVEGFTHDEIAEMLGYTAGTSKSQVFRARRALRKLLEETEEEAEQNVSE